MRDACTTFIDELIAARKLGEKLNRLTADSPDLFAVIQQEGTV